MAKIGALPNGGVRRLALTDEDRRARELFMTWCREIGLEVTIDELGSVYARKKAHGTRAHHHPVILTGSHLDSQPTGGRFDGVLGVLAALEAVQTITEQDIPHTCDFEIVSWTNEEGARFAPAMLASGVFGGAFTRDFALSRSDTEGITIRDELIRIGFNGNRPAAWQAKAQVKAYIELHIEQGPILDRSKQMIGVVTGVQGIRWYDVTIRGMETHAGPSPMAMRNDPVRVLGRLIPGFYALATEFGNDARITIGELTVHPGSRNTVPGMVRLSVDIRHPLAEVLEAMDEKLRLICGRASQRDKIDVTCDEVWNSPPVYFDQRCVEAVEAAAARFGYRYRKMVSGAGHDAVYVSRVAPTGMIFIPCRDGISHNEMEFSGDEQVIAGANVLLATLLNLEGSV